MKLRSLLTPGLLIAGIMLPAIGQSSDKSITITSHTNVVPVVELYTSEGCSSCPPADQWLSQLGEALDENFRAVPLAFHVDYWNYLGWKDPYSSKQYTDRQKDTAQKNRQRTIYTPQFTVTGRDTRGVHKVLERIRKANQQMADVVASMRLTTMGDKVQISLELENEYAASHTNLYFALYENDITRDIGAGENHGRRLMHDYVVRHWSEAMRVNPGRYATSYDIVMPIDAVRTNLGVALVMVDKDTGDTVQSMSTPIAALFES